MEKTYLSRKNLWFGETIIDGDVVDGTGTGGDNGKKGSSRDFMVWRGDGIEPNGEGGSRSFTERL